MRKIRNEKDDVIRYLRGSIFVLIMSIGILIAALGYIRTNANATYEQSTLLIVEKNETATPTLVPNEADYNNSITEEDILSVGKEKIILSLEEGESGEEGIIIKNSGNTSIEVNISSGETNLPMSIKINGFILEPRESETVSLIFRTEGLEPGLYLGSILIHAGSEEKEILFILEVQSKDSHFSLDLEIPSKFFRVSPGSEIDSTTIISTNQTESVNLEYYITSEEISPLIVAKEEVIGEKSFSRKLKIPENLDEGDYVLYVKGYLGESIAVKSFEFRVVESEPQNNPFVAAGIIFIGIAGVAYLLFRYFAPRR